MTTLQVYEQSSIEGTQDSFEGRYDSDGAERSLESFVVQVLFMYLFFPFCLKCCFVPNTTKTRLEDSGERKREECEGVFFLINYVFIYNKIVFI